MQYEDSKTTKLGIRSDYPTSISSTMHGANIGAVGFNIDFIVRRRPQLAVELLRLYGEASDLTADMPVAPDEDFLAADVSFQLQRVFGRHR